MTTSRGRGGWGRWCCASSPHRPVGPGGSGSRSAGQVGGVVADAGGLGHGVVILGLLQEFTAPRPVRLSGELSGSSGFLLVVADGLLAAHNGLLSVVVRRWGWGQCFLHLPRAQRVQSVSMWRRTGAITVLATVSPAFPPTRWRAAAVLSSFSAALRPNMGGPSGWVIGLGGAAPRARVDRAPSRRGCRGWGAAARRRGVDGPGGGGRRGSGGGRG